MTCESAPRRNRSRQANSIRTDSDRATGPAPTNGRTVSQRRGRVRLIQTTWQPLSGATGRLAARSLAGLLIHGARSPRP